MLHDLGLAAKQLCYFLCCILSWLVSIEADDNVVKAVQPLILGLAAGNAALCAIADTDHGVLTAHELVCRHRILFALSDGHILATTGEVLLPEQHSSLVIANPGKGLVRVAHLDRNGLCRAFLAEVAVIGLLGSV